MCKRSFSGRGIAPCEYHPSTTCQSFCYSCITRRSHAATRAILFLVSREHTAIPALRITRDLVVLGNKMNSSAQFKPSAYPSRSQIHSDVKLRSAPSVEKVDMAASFIPPPTASAIIGSARTNRGVSRQHDDLTSIRRTEQALQRHVQLFLDAQADGLLVAGGDGWEADRKSSKSKSALSPPLDHMGAFEQGQAQTELPSLSEARHGIFKTMKQLAKLKGEEAEYLHQRAEDFSAKAQQIDQWEEKQKGLDAEIESMEQDHDGAQVKTLMEELETLRDEINATEATLSELKAQQRATHLRLSRLRNSVESKSSSFKASRSMLDTEIQHFLGSVPPEIPQSTEEEKAYLSLPQSRRTLGMAKDYFNSVKGRSWESQEAAKLEREALREGAARWKTAVNEVIEFEDQLKQEMDEQASEERRHKTKDNHDVQRAREGRGIGALLRDMERISKNLESELEHVQKKGWGLLICCLGAEVEAFKQGYEVLQRALPSSENDQVPLSLLSLGPHKSKDTEDSEDSPTEAHDPEVESEPDPESLLITRQDTDTD